MLFWTPGCEHVNAFSLDWAGENNWLVPPVYLISSTIRYLLTCSAVGTTIVPYWPSAPFWPLIFRSPDVNQSFVKDFKVFEDPSGLLCLGNYKKSLLGSDKLKSPILAVPLGRMELSYMYGGLAVNCCEIFKIV